MSLPLSRNETYTDASPVVSTTINDLQDWVIRHHALLEGQKTFFIGAAEFTPLWTAAQVGAGQVPTTDGFEWEFSSAPNSSACPAMACTLRLPEGIRITAASVYQDATVVAVFNAAAALRRRVMPGATIVDMATAVPDANEPAMTAYPLAIAAGPFPYDVELHAQVQLYWKQEVNTHKFGGFEITLGWPPA